MKVLRNGYAVDGRPDHIMRRSQQYRQDLQLSHAKVPRLEIKATGIALAERKSLTQGCVASFDGFLCLC